jgi:hypothetical protein
VRLEVVDGVPVVCHHADDADAAQLERVAARLDDAVHPGVVRVLSSGPRDGGWELVTEHAGVPVAAAGPIPVAEVADLGARAAATLADLHERRVVHGRIDATHLLIGRGGRVVLCGLGPGTDAGPNDDVAALAMMLRSLMLDGVAAPRAERARWAALERCIDAAAASVPDRRPTARRLATDLASVGAPPGAAPCARRPRRAVAVALAAGAATVALLLRAADGPLPAAGVGPISGAGASMSVASVALRCVATAERPVARAECGHDVQVDSGAVTVDGRQHIVGRPGDDVAVAEWGCAGGLRAAVLRPSTGEVLVLAPFKDDEGGPAVARAERVASARSLSVVADDRGCPSLGVLGRDAAPRDDPSS